MSRSAGDQRSPASDSPLVTVVIATYNWAPVLPYSIASVLAQTMGDFELLVIGDGCTDESEDVVRAIGDDRVHWSNLPVNGRSQAGPNNEALRRARGAYTAHLGHDDLWLPGHLAHLIQAVGEGASFAYGQQLRVDPERAPRITPEASWVFAPGRWISPTSILYRTEHARAVGGWRFPADTGQLDPESDLCARMMKQFGAPARVKHVTSIKFSAATRTDIYRLRPCHEQERWSRRIREADDPELMARRSTSEPVDESLGRLPEESRGPQPQSAAARQALFRRIKGLEP